LDTLPPQLLLPGLGILLVLGFLTAFLKAASIDINDSRLAELAEENQKAKRLLRLLEKEPSAVVGAMESLGYLTAFLFTLFGAIGYFQPVLAWLVALGMESGHGAFVLTGILLAIGMSILYLIVWDLLPKRLGAKYAEKAAVSLSGITCVIMVAGRPLLWVSTLFANVIARLFGVRPHDLEEEVTEEEIRMMVDMGLESGAIDDDEKEMIHNIFEMDDKTVEEIMTHRTEACILWMEDSLEDWKVFIDETNHTRYPVCDEDVDNVVGVVNSRDFYRFMLSGGQKSNIRSIFREPYFVPDSMKADELFSRMQQRNTHMVVVLDEYGGFQGLATQEDLLEEIVGELYSEYDEPEKDCDIQYLDENTWKIKGSTLIEEVEETLGISVPDGDYNTFAGLILDALETLPEDGETAETEVGDLQIKVTSVKEHRIEEAIVCLKREVEEDNEEMKE
jgi:putative hemolysin